MSHDLRLLQANVHNMTIIKIAMTTDPLELGWWEHSMGEGPLGGLNGICTFPVEVITNSDEIIS